MVFKQEQKLRFVLPPRTQNSRAGPVTYGSMETKGVAWHIGTGGRRHSLHCRYRGSVSHPQTTRPGGHRVLDPEFRECLKDKQLKIPRDINNLWTMRRNATNGTSCCTGNAFALVHHSRPYHDTFTYRNLIQQRLRKLPRRKAERINT